MARRWSSAACAVLLSAAACTGGDAAHPPSTSAPRSADRPLPEPVTVRQEPEGVTLGDPAFEALPGAQAEFGRLGGAVYQIEMPDDWNGRLVLWMHGFEEFGPEASVSAPDIRAYLIAQGYAWGASSFSGTGWIPGRSTDESAALWDRFTDVYGRPERTYVIGQSMGGAAGHIAAERYPDRFDGVLALCGSAGAASGLQNPVNVFVAGAFVAGISQAELDAASDVGTLIRDDIRPALRDPERRDRFERIVVGLSGGPRPFDREGFRLEEDLTWRRAELEVAAGLVPHHDTPYHLGPDSGVSDDEFNRSAIRLHSDDASLQAYVDGNEPTGELRIPLLSVHATGDGQVPVEDARILQRRVDDAGHADLLVQRVLRDPGHCGFTTTEQMDSFDALVAWVEHDEKPEGHEVLTADLATLRPAFERQPRPGTPEADAVPGAEDRVVVRGTATIDGAPLEAQFFGVEVVRDGLTTHCQYELSPVTGGAFEVTVRAEGETAGCGAPGADIMFWTYVGEGNLTQVFSTAALPWPGDGATATAEVAFSTTDTGAAAVTSLVGEVLDATGHYAPPGTRVEAFVGDVRCGATSTSRTGSFSGYTLVVAGPDAVRGCTAGGPLTFRVGGHEAAQRTRNDLGEVHSGFDLTVS